MTESTIPVGTGITAPNPIELFWDRHRRTVWTCVTLGAAAVAGYYAWQYFNRQRTNQFWSGVATGVNLDRGYAQDGSNVSFLGMQNEYRATWLRFYLEAARNELLTELPDDLAEIDAAQLSKTLEQVKGTEQEPLVLWLAANRAAKRKEWEPALTVLSDLESRFPTHFLCVKSSYPPQYRLPIDEPKEAEPTERPNKRRKEVKLVDAVEGSAVGLLRTRIEGQRQFQTANGTLYQAVEPDPAPEVVVKLSTEEEVRIRFYRALAPKHVDNFLKLVREGFFNGQAIDQVTRRGTQAAAGEQAEALHFGLEASKQDDRTKWDEARTQPSKITLDFEFNDLSHFPGMLAAEPERDGKSSGERVWINANDVAQWQDGDRVIFGRVVDGLKAIEEICRNRPFEQEQESQSGRGKLQQTIRIESMTIVGEAPKGDDGKDKGGNEEGAGK